MGKNYKKKIFKENCSKDLQFYIINQQKLKKKVKLHIDPKISHQSLSGTIYQKVYVWNLFVPKDRAPAIKNVGETKPYFRDTYSGTHCSCITFVI